MGNSPSTGSRKKTKFSNKGKFSSKKGVESEPLIASEDDVDSSPAAQKTFPVSAAHVEAFNPSQGTSARHENKYRPSSSLQAPLRASEAEGRGDDKKSNAPPASQALSNRGVGGVQSGASGLLASSTPVTRDDCATGSESTPPKLPPEDSPYPVGDASDFLPGLVDPQPPSHLARSTGPSQNAHTIGALFPEARSQLTGCVDDKGACLPSPSRAVPGDPPAILSPSPSFQGNRNGVGGGESATPPSTQIGMPSISYFEAAHNLAIGTLIPTSVGRDQVNYTTNIYQDRADMEERNLDRLREEIRKWLKAPSCREIHATAIDQRTENTGMWFLNSDEFQQLKNGSGCVLWCTGMPGSGKTILASTSIEHLEDFFRGNPSVAVIYTYLRYSEKRTLAEVFVTLLDQLLDHDAAVVKIEPAYREKLSKRVGCTSERDTLRFLKEALSSIIRVFAVIDGLDEATEEVRDGLLQALPSTGVNILIFSRPLDVYAHHTPSAVQVSIQARTDDIALYIDEQFNRNSRLKSILGNRPDLVMKLSNRIKEQANGMFLLARIQLENAMCNSSSPKSLFDSLEKLPSGIDEMYRLTLDRINGQSEQIVSLVHRLLVWLLYHNKSSKARLDTIGIQHALAVSQDTNLFDEDDISPVGFILSACHGLVTISKADSAHWEFRFIHYSAEEFTRNLQFQTIPKPHSYIAATCVGYLDPIISAGMHHANIFSDDNFDLIDKSALISLLRTASPSHPALGYALVNWGYHARLSQDEQCGLPPCILSFLSKYPSYPMCEGSFGGDWDRRIHMAPSLFIAAMHGLTDIIALKTLDFPESDPDPNLWPSHRTPFHIAAHNDHFDAFITLLATYGTQGQALWTYDDPANSAIPHVVLTRVRRSLYFQDTPATAAPFLRQLLDVIDSPPSEELRLCLEGFDINARDYNGRTLLIEACQVRDEDTVRLLVERQDIQTDLRDDQGLSALDTSIQRWKQFDRFGKSPDVPFVLVSSIPNLDLGAPDAAGDTPFIEACRFGHGRLVRYILEHRRGDNMELLRHANRKGLTALMVAIVSARATQEGEEIIHLLLQHGSSLHTKELKFGFTPFLQAVTQHCADDDTLGSNPTDSLELLLSFDGSIIGQRDEKRRTALMLAVRHAKCPPTFIAFLVSHARPPHSNPAQLLNARDDDGCTALMHAIFNDDGSSTRVSWAHVPPPILWNRVEVVKALLSLPTLDVYAPDRMGRGILELVCSNTASRGAAAIIPFVIFFPMLYAILDVERGWDAHLVRRAVIAGVRHLQELAVYRLLLESWVIYSFNWTLDDPDTITLLLQASARKSECRAGVTIVLYHLGLLEPPLLPIDMDLSDHEHLTKAFCRKSSCDPTVQHSLQVVWVPDSRGAGQNVSEERGSSNSGSESQDPLEDRRSSYSGSSEDSSSSDPGSEDQGSQHDEEWQIFPSGGFDWDSCQCICDSKWGVEVVLPELFANRRTYATPELEKMIHKPLAAPTVHPIRPVG